MHCDVKNSGAQDSSPQPLDLKASVQLTITLQRSKACDLIELYTNLKYRYFQKLKWPSISVIAILNLIEYSYKFS